MEIIYGLVGLAIVLLAGFIYAAFRDVSGFSGDETKGD